MPVDKPSVIRGAFCGGKSPLENCEEITARRIEELVKADELLPSVEASKYLFEGKTK